MIDPFSRLPEHRRMGALFWAFNAVIVGALLAFALRV